MIHLFSAGSVKSALSDLIPTVIFSPLPVCALISFSQPLREEAVFSFLLYSDLCARRLCFPFSFIVTSARGGCVFLSFIVHVWTNLKFILWMLVEVGIAFFSNCGPCPSVIG
jgi:hypothetical protein